MSKLTAAALIAMARANGIHLLEVGPTSAECPTLGQNVQAVKERDTRIQSLEADNAKLSAELAKALAAYSGMRSQRQEPANHAELHAARAALTKAIQERDNARDGARIAIDNATQARGALATAASDVNRLATELHEARAQIVALERTVAKLRPTNAPAPVEAPAATGTMRVSFSRFPGYDMVNALRNLGGKWDAKTKEWILPDAPENREKLDAVRAAGVVFSVQRQ